MRIAVVGRGLIGSAAARHLAHAGHDVVLIGPDEPADRAAHEGVFASHYDEGRITRALDADAYWSGVSRASIARYRALEADSGIDFFAETGALIAGPADGAPMRAVAEVQRQGAIRADRLEGRALAERFPMFRFDAGDVAFHEPTAAGHISPRRLVAAQGRLAAAAGAELRRVEAHDLREEARCAVVETAAGPFAADRVLVAAGAFTNALLPDPLPLTVYARTVAFFRVGPSEAARLAAMPPLVYLAAEGRDPYLLPPIRYPDGALYLKLGGDPVDVAVDGAAIGDWFRGRGSAEVGAALAAQIGKRMPDLAVEATETAPCATTFTAADRPVIRRLSDRLAVAVAGCGRGAKCSDELGRLAAEAVCGAPVSA